MIDYDALAKQTGGKTVDDFDALARSVGGTEVVQKEKKGFVEKVGDFLGVTPIAKGISGIFNASLSEQVATESAEQVSQLIDQARMVKDPNIRRSLLKQAQIVANETDKLVGDTLKELPTSNQVVGGAANLALNVATLGGAGGGGSLGAQVLKNAGLGAAFNVADAIEEGEDLSLKSLGASAALGGALPIVGAGLSKVGSAIVERLPTRLVKSALGQTTKELQAGKDVSKFVLENRKVGTANGLLKGAQEAVETLSKQIDDKLLPSTVQVSNTNILDTIVAEINSGGGQITREELKATIQRLAPQAKGTMEKTALTVSEANTLRKALDKTLGDRAFLVSELPFNRGLLKTYANTLREAVKSNVEEVRPLFDELSKEITLRNALSRKIDGSSRNQILSFGDLIGGGLGFELLGDSLIGGGLPGIVGRRVIQSTPFLTGAGVFLNELKKLGPILQKLSPAERQIVLNLIGEID